jgi:hypothetical protein
MWTGYRRQFRDTEYGCDGFAPPSLIAVTKCFAKLQSIFYPTMQPRKSLQYTAYAIASYSLFFGFPCSNVSRNFSQPSGAHFLVSLLH